MARYGDALARYIKNAKAAVNAGLIAVGEDGQSKFKAEPNIKDRIFEGRLEGSMSWATNRSSSGVDGNAKSDDVVPSPKESSIVNIGTGCPYADVHDQGGISGRFAYGQNGNPANRAELEAKIERWAESRGFDKEDGRVPANVIKKICDNIENDEQLAYPFFYAAVKKISADAPKVFAETFLATMRAGNYVNEEKV